MIQHLLSGMFYLNLKINNVGFGFTINCLQVLFEFIFWVNKPIKGMAPTPPPQMDAHRGPHMS